LLTLETKPLVLYIKEKNGSTIQLHIVEDVVNIQHYSTNYGELAPFLNLK